ncbi:MAG: hypothetical protein EBQ95_04290 [Gammaproteobacteria bacterium]|nr:hypothetical protein [Gammaproteobacteria bacterium]
MEKNKTSLKQNQFSGSSVKLLFSPKSEYGIKTGKILTKQGVRVAHLTPQKSKVTAVPLMQSPAGSLYRPIQETCLGLLAKELTPEKDLLKLEREGDEQSLKNTPHIPAHLVPMVQVQEIDRSLLADAKKTVRPNTLSAMKKSANTLLLGEKRLYSSFDQMDWCHLIGHQFLGPTNSENLAPGTHKSNLYTLHAIENPLAKCIRESDLIKSVETTVVARFGNHPVVPEQVEFTAKYKTKRQCTEERFFINPQSCRSLAKSELLAIKTVRTETLENSFDDENNLATEFHWA